MSRKLFSVRYPCEILVCFLLLFGGLSRAQSLISTEFNMKEPYTSLSGSFSGNPVPWSPDPLVSYRWNSIAPDNNMEIYSIRPVSVVSDRPENLRINEGNMFPITVNGPCRLRFDFGQNNAGWLELESDDLDADFRMSISEYNEPAVYCESYVPGDYTRKTAVPEKYGNTCRLEFTDNESELYEGVRFGFVHFDRITHPVTIKNVRLVCQVKPTNYAGSFSSSDTMLNRIWYTAAYTVKTNLLKDYFGSILVNRGDRISWTGDAYPSQAASLVTFGNYEFIRSNLERTAFVNNDIPGYSLLWILSLVDYFNYTGDKDFIVKYTDNAVRILDEAYKYYGVNRVLNFNGWDERLGAGFENPQCMEGQNYYRMLSIRAWREFAAIINQCGNRKLQKKYTAFADEKILELRKDPEWFAGMGVHSCAEAVNAGYTFLDEQEKIWKQSFNDRIQRVSFSPFNTYFIIQSMARMNRYEQAMNTIDDCWGGQIRYGLTTFAEVFHPSWNDVLGPNDPPVNSSGTISLAHPWSAGISKWISEEILGVKPVTGGFKTFMITPHITSGLTYVKGEVPTPRGNIFVHIDMEQGFAEFRIPENTEAMIGIPKAGREIVSIRCREKDLKQSSEDEHFIYFSGILPGYCSFSVIYRGIPPPPLHEDIIYECGSEIMEDMRTMGNWKEKYGSRGYILFNYDESGHRIHLPDFVDEVHFKKRGNVNETHNANVLLALNSPEIRALESDKPDEHSRNLGAICTRDPICCYQSTPVDIRCRERIPYQLAIYFVDWERMGRQTGVEIFDLETSEMLVPTQVVRNYEDGKYLIFQLDRSVRIRIDQIRGENAMMSALFFD